MRLALLLLVLLFVVASVHDQGNATEDKRPAMILNVTDYRGPAGPMMHFDLAEDGSWKYAVRKGGKEIEARHGRFDGKDAKALLDFVNGLEPAKHARDRKVEDAAM